MLRNYLLPRRKMMLLYLGKSIIKMIGSLTQVLHESKFPPLAESVSAARALQRWSPQFIAFVGKFWAGVSPVR